MAGAAVVRVGGPHLDELRAILRRVESSGTPRKDLARRVGLPVARVALLLIGHQVPISTKSAAPYVWNLLQAFYASLPQYQSRDFGIFTESYGGHYGA